MLKIGFSPKDFFITGRNEVVAKVMFLLVSVILFTGGGVCYPSMPCSRSRGGGVCSWGVSAPVGCMLLGVCSGGGGVCSQEGGVCSRRGVSAPRRGLSAPRGECLLPVRGLLLQWTSGLVDFWLKVACLI